jgi:nitrite reductase/ring-hydroxylating ferredoxin subunit
MRYPVALAADVPAGTVTGTRLHGVELAVWRDPAGQAHVWRDLCPHRGMRLSLGFQRDGALACPYHGWRFAPSGRCVHLPAHPRAVPPASVSVQRYHAVEASGLLWAATEPFEVPDRPARPVRSVTVHRPSAFVHQALHAKGLFTDALDPGTDSVLYAVQPVADDVTAVHVVHLGTASVAALVALAVGAAALRAELETAVGAGV